MTNFDERMPTAKDLEFILNFLYDQDIVGAMGSCADYMNEAGYCMMCTGMERLQSLVAEMQYGTARIVEE